MRNNIVNNKALIFSNVSFTYPCGNKAIKDLSFSINKGLKTGIIGPNGAGKSTLLTLLNGTRVAEGEIIISGLPLNKKNLKKIKNEVGIVFQNPEDQLFCVTIEDDIAFGPMNLGVQREEIENRVAIALENVGLGGYEKKSAHMLSFGERKLASIATVLSMDPSVVALDEPSANLDPYHRRKIIDWINSQQQKTIIITSHDLDLIAETCDEVILLAKGKKIIHTTAKEVLNNVDILEAHSLELPLSLQQIHFK